MNWIKRKIQRFKEKTIFQKAFDLLFLGFIVMMLFPDGRLAFQRLILQTGVISADIITEDRIQISEDAFQSFVFTDEKGKEHTLEEYKGKVIFLNFWATWCPPCRAELPSISTLYRKMESNNDIVFLFLSYESKEVVTAFDSEFGYNLPFSSLTYKVPEELNPPGLPTTFIIDKKGRIASQTTGMAKWDSDDFYIQLESLIKE